MNQSPPRTARHAFTLVELSIVLVIVALLVGGVFAGRSLIRASQLRSVMTDAQSYLAAAGNFRTSYKALPGDLPNATSYWTTGTADGNGDGSVAEGGENFRFWQHLRLAEMIGPSLTGTTCGAGPNAACFTGANANVPASRIESTGFAFFYFNSAGDANTYQADYGNMLVYGGYNAGNEPIKAAVSPADAYSMDLKSDDGKPGTGKWIAHDNTGFGAAASCTGSANATDYAGGYNLTTVGTVCSLYIMSGM